MYEFWIVENFIKEKLNVVTAKNYIAGEQIMLTVLALWLREHAHISCHYNGWDQGVETNGVRQKSNELLLSSNHMVDALTTLQMNKLNLLGHVPSIEQWTT